MDWSTQQRVADLLIEAVADLTDQYDELAEEDPHIDDLGPGDFAQALSNMLGGVPTEYWDTRLPPPDIDWEPVES